MMIGASLADQDNGNDSKCNSREDAGGEFLSKD